MANDTLTAVAKQFDNKTLTTAGAVIIAMFALYIIWQLVSDDFASVSTEVSAHSIQASIDQREYVNVLGELKGVIEDNNRLIETFLITR